LTTVLLATLGRALTLPLVVRLLRRVPDKPLDALFSIPVAAATGSIDTIVLVTSVITIALPPS